MTWELREQEIQSILAKDGKQRYEYAIKKIADFEVVWSLRNELGWVLLADDSGKELVPVWPHEHYAAMSSVGPWEDCTPTSIELDVWLDRWIPGLERDDRRIAVFPTPDTHGTIIDPRAFESDLRDELSQLE